MKRSRIAYRVRQFWQTLRAKPDQRDLDQARAHLTPKQMGLFRNMGPEERAHAVRVLETLKGRGEVHPDLLVAALLHDVGKVRCPLTAWERSLAVLGRRFAPERAKNWGQGRPRGWRRPFVVAEQHPYWGAQIAAECGVSSLSVNLIWRHQEPPSTIPKTEEDRLLRTLQAADDDS
jgi:hypothetical protein